MCIPLCGNTVCILPISSERIGIYLWNLAALIQVSIGPFGQSYTWNLKHLRIRELQLFITTYYYYKFLTWYEFETYIGETFLINEVGQQWFFQFDHLTFSWKWILACKFCTVLLPNLLRTKVNFMACLNVEISTKKLQTL